MIQNLNFGPRLLLLTTLLSAFMIAIGIIGLHGMARTLDGLESVYIGQNHYRSSTWARSSIFPR